MAEVIARRYSVLSSLGRGGMGEVFLAEDLLLGRRVAIKRILRSSGVAPDAVAVERLIREARLAAMLHHPHVVAVHDLITENDSTHIVMEYLESRSLAEMIRAKRRLEPALVGRIGGHVASALEAAHRAGIIHRDVKPSNILVQASGVAKLADFGVARNAGDPGLTGTGMMIGSIAYMAPEIAKGEEITAAADIYSLGATLFAAVEGHAPFASVTEPSNSIRMLARLITESAPDAVHAGPLTDLIRRMMLADPTDRPTAAEVQRSLAVLTAEPVAPVVRPPVPPILPAVQATPADEDPTRLAPKAQSVPSSEGTQAATILRKPTPAIEPTVRRTPERPAPTKTAVDRPDKLKLLAKHPWLPPLVAIVVMSALTSIPVVLANLGPRVVGTIALASAPRAVAVDPANERLYTANTLDDTVTVIDTTTNKATATIKVGDFPTAVAVDPANRELYTANAHDDTVTVIDTTTNKATATIKVGDFPAAIAAAPNIQRLYVANAGANTVTVIDTSANKAFVTIKVGQSPTAIAVDSEAGIAFVGLVDNRVRMIDTTSNRVVASIALDTWPSALAFDSDKNQLYAAHPEDTTLTVLDTANRTVDTIAVGHLPTALAVDSAAGRLYVASRDETVTVIDTSTNTVSATVKVDPWSNSVTVDPASERVYVANAEGKTVTLIQG